MREVKCQGKTLSFWRKKDNKVVLRLDFPHNVDAFYFSEDERLLLIWGEKRIFRYEIPCFPDENNTFLKELFAQRRENV